MAQGVPGDTILLLTPQRTLATPYYQALRHPGVIAGGMVDVLTLGGLTRRMVELFWPLVSAQAGFSHPDRPPIFLNLETAQYYMARLVRPLFDQGYFDAVVINRNRLYSQVLDNLNKAAVVGFPHTEIGARLKASWVGEASQLRIYEDAQACAALFRAYCLEHNLLDFSLQVEIFRDLLWPASPCRSDFNGNLPPPAGGQPGRGHPGDPRSAGRVAACPGLGLADLRPASRLPQFSWRRSEDRLRVEGNLPGQG